MDTFYDKKGKVLGHAWSAAIDSCHKTLHKEKHKPHPFSPEFAMYGPYMCAGYPPVKMYDQPPRKPVN